MVNQHGLKSPPWQNCTRKSPSADDACPADVSRAVTTYPFVQKVPSLNRGIRNHFEVGGYLQAERHRRGNDLLGGANSHCWDLSVQNLKDAPGLAEAIPLPLTQKLRLGVRLRALSIRNRRLPPTRVKANCTFNVTACETSSLRAWARAYYGHICQTTIWRRKTPRNSKSRTAPRAWQLSPIAQIGPTTLLIRDKAC